MIEQQPRDRVVTDLEVVDVICDRCGGSCDYFAAGRNPNGLSHTNRGWMRVPPRFVYSQLSLGHEMASFNVDTGYDVQLCLACTKAVCDFINLGPGPGAREIYYDPMGG